MMRPRRAPSTPCIWCVAFGGRVTRYASEIAARAAADLCSAICEVPLYDRAPLDDDDPTAIYCYQDHTQQDVS